MTGSLHLRILLNEMTSLFIFASENPLALPDRCGDGLNAGKVDVSLETVEVRLASGLFPIEMKEEEVGEVAVATASECKEPIVSFCMPKV